MSTANRISASWTITRSPSRYANREPEASAAFSISIQPCGSADLEVVADLELEARQLADLAQRRPLVLAAVGRVRVRQVGQRRGKLVAARLDLAELRRELLDLRRDVASSARSRRRRPRRPACARRSRRRPRSASPDAPRPRAAARGGERRARSARRAPRPRRGAQAPPGPGPGHRESPADRARELVAPLVAAVRGRLDRGLVGVSAAPPLLVRLLLGRVARRRRPIDLARPRTRRRTRRPARRRRRRRCSGA